MNARLLALVASTHCSLYACSNDGDRDRERIKRSATYPEVIASELPAKAPPPPPPKEVVRRRDRSLNEEINDVEYRHDDKEFYETEYHDDVYDVNEAGRANEAFDMVMKTALDPLAEADKNSDVDDPSNQPSAKEVVPEKPKVEERLSCRPRLALRKAASDRSAIVARLPVGTKLKVIGRSAETLVGKGHVAGWVHVNAGEGRVGWLADTTTRSIAQGEDTAAYLACCGVDPGAADEASAPRERFVERHDYVACLSRAIADRATATEAVDLVVARNVALAHAAQLVERSEPMGEPYKSFMKRYGGQLSWDPDGYALRASEVWAAEEKYHGEPTAEALAWQAANDSAVERDCNHEVVCAITQARAYWGEYLERHPTGQHASQALDAIARIHPRSDTDTSYELDRNIQRVEQCLATVDELTRIVESTRAVGRVQALGSLEGVRRFVLARSGHLQTKR